MQEPMIIRPAESMKSSLNQTVLLVFNEQQRIVKENLLGLSLTDAMFSRILAAIAFIPVKALDPDKVNHFCIL